MQIQRVLLRSIVSMPFVGAALFALALLEPGDARAESCIIDPFGAEVCLPTSDPDDPPEEPEAPEDPEDPSKFVNIPPCFGPCKDFPPPPAYRQYEETPEPEPEPEPTPEPTPEPPPAPVEPIRPLWFKSEALDHATAEAYLDQKLRNYYLAQSQNPTVDFNDAPVVIFNGVRYLEILEPNTALLSGSINEPGFNVWVRGFGGQDSVGSSRGRYADFSSGGAQLGFDVPLSRSTRIGLFGTYALMNGDDGSRGGWDADGWGGGGYAEYWTDNFYLRGMISAGGYSGDHSRNADGETYRGKRSGNSWTGVISLGAPFDSGDWIIEPQALFSYTNTSLDRFSESSGNRSDRLRYSEMELDRFDTELSMKFTHPIRDGQASLFMPSLRLGWVADWGQSGDKQKVSFINADRNNNWSLNDDSNHGALIELGLDYTTYNFTDTSMGVYARTGVVLWGGDRGTSWQVQGGLNFRF